MNTQPKRLKHISSYNTVIKRVGTSPEARARWLIHFANSTLVGLSPKKLQLLREEVTVFTYGKIFYGPSHFLPTEMLMTSQQQIRKYLEELKTKKGFFLQPKVQYAFWVRDGKLCNQIRAVEDPFGFEVFKALTESGKHFRLCLNCQNPFITNHSQRYCSPSCSQKVRTERYKALDPERWKKRNQARYRKTVQKKHPGAKLHFKERGTSKRRADYGDL